MLNFLPHLDVSQLANIGYIGLTLIILCETGLFLGFFLPGDSLLFTAGLLAAKGIFNPFILIFLLVVAAFIGYGIAYWIGDKIGHLLLKREDSFWFKKRYLIEAHDFYAQHGGKALIIGRLIPVIRTFVPLVAGMVNMPFRRYYLYNIAGAIIWAGGITSLGYYMGAAIPEADQYLLPIVLLIIFLSLLPGIYHLTRSKRRKSNTSV